MRVITDTYISSQHFKPIDNGDMVALECDLKDLPFLHLNLREWLRQMDEVMKYLGVEAQV